MTSWLNHHHHHPWFVAPSLKRKLSLESDGDHDAASNNQPQRKRLHKLERGLAELTLQHHVPGISVSPQLHSPLSPSSPVVGLISPLIKPNITATATNVRTSSQTVLAQDNTIVYPTSIEEPPSPELEVPEVKMTSSSWYEPEKDSTFFHLLARPQTLLDPDINVGIIVTQLDSDSEDEIDKVNGTVGMGSLQGEEEYTISPVFLNALNKKLGIGSLDQKPDTGQRSGKQENDSSAAPSSQALVLFQPRMSPLLVRSVGREVDNDGLIGGDAADKGSLLDDPMDVELP